MMKRALFFLLILLLLPVVGLAQMEQTAENDACVLYMDQGTMNFCVENKQTGRRLYAFPEDWNDDPYAKGANKKLIASLVSVDLYNEKNVSKTVNSYTGCLEKGEYSCTVVENGFDISLYFQAEEVRMRLEIRLTQDGFTLYMPIEYIEENGDRLLGSIRVLPFLHAGRETDEGYIFLPDGSGTLMDFDGSFGLKSRVVRTIYGRDLSIMNAILPQPEESCFLPVYGMKTNDTGFLAVVEKGEYTCQLLAQAALDNARYFRVSPVFTYRAIQNIVLFENTTDERTVTALSTQPPKEGLQVRVIFLEDDEANYSGMARAYRNYLLDAGKLTQKDTTPYVDMQLYGAAEKSVVTMGIPHKALHTFTTFEQAGQIMQEAAAAGIGKMNAYLYGFHQGGTKNKWTSTFEPERALGGWKAFSALMDTAKEANGTLTLVSELLRAQKNGNGFREKTDAARSISDGIAYQYVPNKIDQRRDYSEKPTMMLAPEQLHKRWETYASSLSRIGDSAILLDEWGTNVYSQFGKENFATRDEVGALWETVFEESRVKVVADGGNAYVLPYVERLLRLPAGDSAMDMTTRSIPFYQMVLHGYLPYSAGVSNRMPTREQSLLQLMEQGAYPCYEWFFAPSGDTLYTCLDSIYSGYYAPWMDQAAQEYAACAELYRATEGSCMLTHDRLAKDVFRVCYENGAICYVNYGKQDVTVEEVLIPACDYVIREAGV